MSKNNLKKLLEIYFSFFKLGCFSFGGGYAMIPLIEHEVVEKKKWIEKEKIIDIFAVSQSIPGAIAMNSSAFVGYSIQGVTGAVTALLGNITPSVIIVLVLNILLSKFSSYPVVQSAFNGIRPAIIALIAYAGYKLGKTSIVDLTCLLIMVAAFIATFYMHPIIMIIGGALTGITIAYVKSIYVVKKTKNDLGM